MWERDFNHTHRQSGLPSWPPSRSSAKPPPVYYRCLASCPHLYPKRDQAEWPQRNRPPRDTARARFAIGHRTPPFSPARYLAAFGRNQQDVLLINVAAPAGVNPVQTDPSVKVD